MRNHVDSEAQHSLFVTYHVFCVSDGHRWPDDEIVDGNGLVNPFPGGAHILTGIHTGPVNVVLRHLDRPPTELDPEEWEEIVDVSVKPRGTKLRLRSIEHGDDGPALDAAPVDSALRIRVHARGRDTDPDGSPETAVEDYLIEYWTAPEEAETIQRQGDEYGEELRSLAAGDDGGLE